MKNILFIGASGFVGTRLTDICKSDFAITNLDKQQSPFFHRVTILENMHVTKAA
jgi:dTDP-4-dehydrorhamnose reductase